MAQTDIVASGTSLTAVIDAIASDGTAKTDLVYNTANLAAAYWGDNQSSETSITLATMTLGTWTSGGFKHVGGGSYQLCVPNAAFSGGAKVVHIRLYDSSTGWQFGKAVIQLTAWNNQDATSGGISRIDAAVSSRGTSTLTAANVWDALLSGITTSSSIGKLIKDYLDAAVSSRASQASLDTLDDYVDTEVAALQTTATNIYNIVNDGTIGNEAIQQAITAVSPSSSVATGRTLTYGTESGTYSDTTAKDASYHSITPHATNALSITYNFNVGVGNIPSSFVPIGYWSGSGQYAEVYAYDYDAAAFVKISGTTATTRFNHRTSDYQYTFELSRQYVDSATGDVQIKYVSASTNGAHLLKINKQTVYYKSEAASEGGLTAANVWQYSQRQLTSDGLDLILCADGATLWKNACVHGAVVLMGVTAGVGTTSETFTKYGYVVTSTNDGTDRTATSVA